MSVIQLIVCLVSGRTDNRIEMAGTRPILLTASAWGCSAEAKQSSPTDDRPRGMWPRASAQRATSRNTTTKLRDKIANIPRRAAHWRNTGTLGRRSASSTEVVSYECKAGRATAIDVLQLEGRNIEIRGAIEFYRRNEANASAATKSMRKRPRCTGTMRQIARSRTTPSDALPVRALK